MAIVNLTTPISENAIRSLHVGDEVRLYGAVVTARDAAHKSMQEHLLPRPGSGRRAGSA